MSDLRGLAERATPAEKHPAEIRAMQAVLTPERVLAMLDVIRAARTLGKVALSVEGALLAYWTDIPQGVIQDALPRLRAALEESAEALAALDALTGEGDE